MLLGEEVILPQERLELPSGITAAYGQRIWVALAAANMLPLPVSTTREKSLEPRISRNRSFQLSGRRRAAFGGFPCCAGDNCGQAFGINKYGHVVGYSSGPNGRKAFLWTRRAGAHNLGVLPGGNYSSACDINDLDEVAGTSASAAGDRAFLWTKAGDMRDLGTLPGDTSSEASAINNNGDVVGYSKGPRGMRAFLWTQATGMQDFGRAPRWKLQPSAWYQRHGRCGWNFDKLVGRSRLYLDTTRRHERSEQRSSLSDFRGSVC